MNSSKFIRIDTDVELREVIRYLNYLADNYPEQCADLRENYNMLKNGYKFDECGVLCYSYGDVPIDQDTFNDSLEARVALLLLLEHEEVDRMVENTFI
jgi:hypothetical protein